MREFRRCVSPRTPRARAPTFTYTHIITLASFVLPFPQARSFHPFRPASSSTRVLPLFFPSSSLLSSICSVDTVAIAAGREDHRICINNIATRCFRIHVARRTRGEFYATAENRYLRWSRASQHFTTVKQRCVNPSTPPVASLQRLARVRAHARHHRAWSRTWMERVACSAAIRPSQRNEILQSTLSL